MQEASVNELNELLILANILLVVATAFLVWAAFSQARAAKSMKALRTYEILQRFLDSSDQLIVTSVEQALTQELARIKNIVESSENEGALHAIDVTTLIEQARNKAHNEATNKAYEALASKMDLMSKYGVLDKPKKPYSILEAARRLRMFAKWLSSGDMPSDHDSRLHSLLKCMCEGK